MNPTLIFLLALQALPPPPPSYVAPPPVLHSPKHTEMVASLGAPMVKALARPTPAFVPTDFAITNLTVNGGTVNLQWQQGLPLFQVQATSLDGQWTNVGPLTTARTKSFAELPQRFFRIVQSNSLPLIINPTNQPRLTWTTPEIAMSDTLQPYTLQETQTAPPANQPTSDNTGWSPSPTTPSPAANATSANDTTGTPVWYRLKQTTANGVVVPYAVATLNTVASGTATLVQQIKQLSHLRVLTSAIATDASGNIYVTGVFEGSASFDGGATSRTANMANGNTFLVKYQPDGTFVWIRILYVPAGNIIPKSLCVGPDGNVTFGGTFNGTNGTTPPATLTELVVGGVSLPCDTLSQGFAFAIQYTSGGSLVWSKSYGPVNPISFTAMADNGTFTYASLVFTGIATDPGTGAVGPGAFNFQLLKIARNGSVTLLVNAGATNVNGFQQVFVNSILQDASGNLLLSGSLGGVTDMDGFTTPSGGMFMAKYSSTVAHTLIWSPTKVRVYPGAVITGAALEGSGEIIVCGPFTGNIDIGGGSSRQIQSGSTSQNLTQASFIAGYASDGSWNWQIAYRADMEATGAGQQNSARSVVVSGGQIYVFGESGNPGMHLAPDDTFINPNRLYIVSLTSNGASAPTRKWFELAQPQGGGAFVSAASGIAIAAGNTGPVAYGVFGTGIGFVQPNGPTMSLTGGDTQDGFIVRYLP